MPNPPDLFTKDTSTVPPDDLFKSGPAPSAPAPKGKISQNDFLFKLRKNNPNLKNFTDNQIMDHIKKTRSELMRQIDTPDDAAARAQAKAQYDANQGFVASPTLTNFWGNHPSLRSMTKGSLDTIPVMGGYAGGLLAGPETGGLGVPFGRALGGAAGSELRDFIAQVSGVEPPSGLLSRLGHMGTWGALEGVGPAAFDTAMNPVSSARYLAGRVDPIALKILPRKLSWLKPLIDPEFLKRFAKGGGEEALDKFGGSMVRPRDTSPMFPEESPIHPEFDQKLSAGTDLGFNPATEQEPHLPFPEGGEPTERGLGFEDPDWLDPNKPPDTRLVSPKTTTLQNPTPLEAAKLRQRGYVPRESYNKDGSLTFDKGDSASPTTPDTTPTPAPTKAPSTGGIQGDVFSTKGVPQSKVDELLASGEWEKGGIGDDKYAQLKRVVKTAEGVIGVRKLLKNEDGSPDWREAWTNLRRVLGRDPSAAEIEDAMDQHADSLSIGHDESDLPALQSKPTTPSVSDIQLPEGGLPMDMRAQNQLKNIGNARLPYPQ